VPANLSAIVQKINAKQFGSAVKLALREQKKAPKDPEIARLAGIALAGFGKHVEAARQLTKAINLGAKDIATRQNLVKSLLASQSTQKACEIAQKWTATNSSDPDLWFLQATCHLQADQITEAVFASGEALKLRPQMAKARMLRGFALSELGSAEAALEDFLAVRQSDPKNPEIALNISALQERLHRQNDATATLEKAIKDQPTNAELRFALGMLHTESGDFPHAKEQFNTALRLYPGYFEAFHQLVEIREKGDEPRLIAHATSQLEDVSITEDARTTLEIGKAVLALSLGDKKTAGHFFQCSNARRAKTHPYNPKVAEAKYDNTIAMYPDAKHLGIYGDIARPKPIFVVGLPRSGTTLTELVLTAHSAVFGLGEFDAVEQDAEDMLAGNLRDPFEASERYRSLMPEMPEAIELVVDKTPHNFQHIGFLKRCFPEARFIHLTRDPRDIAYSMWQRHFLGTSTFYTSRLDWIAHAVNLHQRYMAHWKQVYAQDIMTLPYEELVHDVETASKRMAAFCDLHWQAAMAHPEQNHARVSTASVAQVRQGVHQKATGKWRELPEVIDTFVAHLDPALWPEIDLS